MYLKLLFNKLLLKQTFYSKNNLKKHPFLAQT